MKKIFICFCVFFVSSLNVSANNIPNLGYKNIKNKETISYNQETGVWGKKSKQNINYTKVKGFGTFYDYLDSNKNYSFSTNCEYEFIYKGRLIGYSNDNMKFYDFTFINGNFEKYELNKDEVEQMLPDYKIITFSDFSKKTNSLKIKKEFGSLKLLLLNDTDKIFDNYSFTTGNAKFLEYSLRGFLEVTKSGMIQFSDNNKNNDKPWFIILVR